MDSQFQHYNKNGRKWGGKEQEGSDARGQEQARSKWTWFCGKRCVKFIPHFAQSLLMNITSMKHEKYIEYF